MSNELNAYLGVLLESLLKQGYSASEVKHLISAGLTEYIMETLSVDNDGSRDYYAIRPMLVAVKQVIDLEFKAKQEDAYIPQVAADMAKLQELSKYLEHRIEVIKPKC